MAMLCTEKIHLLYVNIYQKQAFVIEDFITEGYIGSEKNIRVSILERRHNYQLLHVYVDLLIVGRITPTELQQWNHILQHYSDLS